MASNNETNSNTLKELKRLQAKNEVVKTSLNTDERVIARVTDGIYREPSSALRELIVNAYDADAENVIIQTDAPRFSEIVIRDDGMGMSEEALVSLIERIGGSSKRTKRAAELGTASRGDPTRSPEKGRKLVGKIGIGLFSVAQLTRKFRITTKQEGKAFRLVADVVLKTWSDEKLEELDDDGIFEAGTVNIRSVKAEKEGHGTEISIHHLLPRVKKQLRSIGKWEAVYNQPDRKSSIAPTYHVGKVNPETDEFIKEASNLPWNGKDDPADKFRKLVGAVLEKNRFQLSQHFDNYLRTIWDVSLAIPLEYVGKHPFDLAGPDDVEVYSLSNKKTGQAEKLDLGSSESVRDRLDLIAPQRPYNDRFRVLFDGIEIKRPQDPSRLPFTRSALKERVLFVGSRETTFGGAVPSLSGGKLEFEAYLAWAPKVIPKEHRGVLIRIHDASGTLFDETFMKWQVAETTKKTQITAEVFVTKGLEGALNIDRESFNESHPHYQFITSWLHNALRQVVNTVKKKERGVRKEKREKRAEESLTKISATGEQILASAQEEFGTSLDYFRFIEDLDMDSRSGDQQSENDVSPDDSPEDKSPPLRQLNLPIDEIFDNAIQGRKTKPRENRLRELKEKTKYLIMTLAAYGTLDGLTDDKVEQLCKDISTLIVEDELD